MRIRASDADREIVTQRLRDAFTEGRLDHLELEERLERALTAKIYADLAELVADLPQEPVLPEPSATDVVVLESKHGEIKRTGDWAVPRRLRAVSKYGQVHLDFSEAVIAHRVVEVDLDLTYGAATIVLPQGASVDIDGFRAPWGVTRTNGVPGRRRPDALHVIVTGETGYGWLAVRYPRKRWFTQS